MLAPRGAAVKDRPALAFVKRLVRWFWSVELWLRRTLGWEWRRRFWVLAGACRACGACCVEPTVHAGPFTWHFSVVRRLFLAWQSRVNGFELLREEPDSNDLVFRCTHYDPDSRRCDSYRSRPSMCRDYPTVLLDQGWPELFPTCGYRVRARKPEKLRAGIEATSLSPEAKAELCRRMRLE
jgi:Fe-S-cluster containining protein